MNSKRIAKENLKAVCSVSEMAQLLGLSRSRFYELQKHGAFPQPLYDIATKRPFYPKHLQRRCLKIRNTGIGNNRQRILFYRRRKRHTPSPKTPVPQHYEFMIKTLRQLGFKATLKQLKAALQDLYPKGLPVPNNDDVVIGKLIAYWHQHMSR